MRLHWYFYLVRCRDGSLYADSTNDLTRCIEEHNAGRGGRYTSSHRPVELVYAEQYLTRNETLRREAAVKALRRSQKETLMHGRGFTPLGVTGVWRASCERGRPAERIAAWQAAQADQPGRDAS